MVTDIDAAGFSVRQPVKNVTHSLPDVGVQRRYGHVDTADNVGPVSRFGWRAGHAAGHQIC